MIILWLVCTSGHLLSTAEVESALVEHEAVVEAAVVSRPHPVKGESLYCFVTLTDGVSFSRTLEAQLKKQGTFWFYVCVKPTTVLSLNMIKGIVLHCLHASHTDNRFLYWS